MINIKPLRSLHGYRLAALECTPSQGRLRSCNINLQKRTLITNGARMPRNRRNGNETYSASTIIRTGNNCK